MLEDISIYKSKIDQRFMKIYSLDYRSHPIYGNFIRVDFEKLSRDQLNHVRDIRGDKGMEFIGFGHGESEVLGGSGRSFFEAAITKRNRFSIETNINELLAEMGFERLKE